MQEFFTFRRTKEPFDGMFRPSTQLLSNSPICQGFAHLEKSEVGMASRLVCVSMVSGKMVMTLPSKYSFFSAFSAKLVARQCTPALANAQAIISACGSLQTAAAPVKTTIPLGLRNLVARCAASRLGQRLTSFMSLTFSIQSASLMLPPVHPPAVTKIALYLMPICRMLSTTARLFSSTFFSRQTMMFLLACQCGLRSTLTTLYCESMDTTRLPSCPLPPMHRIFFIVLRPLVNYNKMSGVHSQNQFITTQQLQRQYLNELIEARRRQGERVAYRQAELILDRVIGRLEAGMIKIVESRVDVKDLLIEKQPTEEERRLIENRKRNQEKQRINRLLYPRKKSQESCEEEDGKKVLSADKHREFMRELKNQKMMREMKNKDVKEKEAKERERSEEKARLKEEEDRLDSIQRKKLQIQENLRKMKENHEKFIVEEKESKAIFNMIRKKKRLYEHLKETYEQKVVLPTEEENRKKLEEIKGHSRLNLQEIEAHEKEYLEWKKKSQASLDKSQVSSKNSYNPPPHSKKIQKILAQDEKAKHKLDMQKRLVKEKIERMNNYTALLTIRNPLPETNKTIAATQRQTSQKDTSFSRRQSKDRHKLGNIYLQQARKALRQRAKTEEGQKTQFIEKGPKKKQSKAMSMHYIDTKTKQTLTEQSKRQQTQIQSILSGDFSPLQRLKKIRQADQRLSTELRKKQSKLRLKFNKKNDQSALNIILTTIRAKLNLLDCYDKLS